VKYNFRPASCRQFPFSIQKSDDGFVIGIDMNCPSIQEMIQKDQTLVITSEEKKAAELLVILQAKILQNKKTVWFKDVGTGIWIKG
jgi:Fe-S-cluster containining protein